MYRQFFHCLQWILLQLSYYATKYNVLLLILQICLSHFAELQLNKTKSKKNQCFITLKSRYFIHLQVKYIYFKEVNIFREVNVSHIIIFCFGGHLQHDNQFNKQYILFRLIKQGYKEQNYDWTTWITLRSINYHSRKTILLTWADG